MVSLIGFWIAIIAGINAAWSLFLYIMFVAGVGGAKLSKKVGTDNKNTDANIEVGKNESKKYLRSFIIRSAIALIAYLVYIFVPETY